MHPSTLRKQLGEKLILSTPSQHAAARDIYLSPHPDDVCFSLGLLASARRAGTLLTVFTTSQFVQRAIHLSAYLDEQVNQVTALRRAEDQRFADASGLRLDHVGCLDAPLRGRGLTDRSMVPIDAAAIEAQLLESVERTRVAAPRHLRPWIFCPMGIGGHIDHLTVCQVILNNLDFLRRIYRVAFYEELPYASDPRLRYEGLRRFMSGWPDRPLERWVLRFAGATQKKLNLIRIYTSQFRTLPSTFSRFQPAHVSAKPPCECVWIT